MSEHVLGVLFVSNDVKGQGLDPLWTPSVPTPESVMMLLLQKRMFHEEHE